MSDRSADVTVTKVPVSSLLRGGEVLEGEGEGIALFGCHLSSSTKMDDHYVVPVFYHRGNFIRRGGSELVYVHGKVEKFLKMDIDFINFEDLITLFKGLGYQSYKTVYCSHSYYNKAVEVYSQSIIQQCRVKNCVSHSV
ncbi:uncharacterized protein DS421_16g553330 [Arachis hypogaea]|uniref:PB1-like domain-containing protein n=1 Tax=Arachis hypogaea TaxID=3818 RepID=A0A444YST3_ARAHY|nr:uncharacterized protein DS421_16g553330 [Arachis hypogaea]RYR04971.1 hypothetical protein Ahy_B06g084786 [Arachis hypogaea]